MDKKFLGFIILIIVIFLMVGGYFVFMQSSDDENSTTSIETNAPADEISDQQPRDVENVEKEDGVIDEDDNMDEEKVATSGSYIEYSEGALTDDTNLIFFHAGWCPTCRLLDEDLVENEADIPSDLTILKVDFDTGLDLRREYDVTVQHTLVQVDSEGNMIKSWVGSLSLEDLLEEV